MRDSTLRLRLVNTPFKGSIAANVVLGVVIAAGVPPLAADRARESVDEAVSSATGDVELWARHQDGVATVGIRAGGEEWLEAAAATLDAYEPIVADGELQLAFRRSRLRAVSESDPF